MRCVVVEVCIPQPYLLIPSLNELVMAAVFTFSLLTTSVPLRQTCNKPVVAVDQRIRITKSTH